MLGNVVIQTQAATGFLLGAKIPVLLWAGRDCANQESLILEAEIGAFCGGRCKGFILQQPPE